MFVSWCGDGGIWAQCLFAHWKICKWPDLEKVIVKVLETFDGVENLSAKQRDGNVNFICRHDVLAVLPTGFRKSLLFQLIPGLCVELHNLGYSYYRYAKSPIVFVICENALIQCQMKQLEHRQISCTCLSGEDADQDGAFAGRYSFIFANPKALILNEKWRKMLQMPVSQKIFSGLLLIKLM